MSLLSLELPLYTAAALFSGVVYGWSSLQLVLERDGQYEELCDGGEPGCAAQLNRLGAIFTVGNICMMSMSLPAGTLLDRFGPLFVVCLSGLLVTAAALGLAVSESRGGVDLFAPSYGLLGMGGTLCLFAAFPASFLSKSKSRVLTAVNVLFDASSVVFFLCMLLHRETDVSRRAIFLGYAAAAVCVYSALAWAWRSRLAAVYALKQRNSAPVPGDGAPAMHQQPLAKQLRSPEFKLLLVFMALHTLHSNSYLGTNKDWLEHLGDDEHDYAFTATFAIFLPLSALWFPVFGWVMDKYGVVASLQIVNVAGILHCAVVCVPVLQVQLLAFFIYTNYRALLYSLLSTFVAVSFGPSTAGRMQGAIFTLAAVFNVLVYPSISITNDLFDGDYTAMHLVHLVAFCALVRPVQLMRARVGAVERSVIEQDAAVEHVHEVHTAVMVG